MLGDYGKDPNGKWALKDAAVSSPHPVESICIEVICFWSSVFFSAFVTMSSLVL